MDHQRYAASSHGLHQHLRAQRVGEREALGNGKGAFDMAFGGGMHHQIGPFQDLRHQVEIADVALLDRHPSGAQGSIEMRHICGIGESIEHADARHRTMGQKVIDGMGADKAGATRHDDGADMVEVERGHGGTPISAGALQSALMAAMPSRSVVPRAGTTRASAAQR